MQWQFDKRIKLTLQIKKEGIVQQNEDFQTLQRRWLTLALITAFGSVNPRSCIQLLPLTPANDTNAIVWK